MAKVGEVYPNRDGEPILCVKVYSNGQWLGMADGESFLTGDDPSDDDCREFRLRGWIYEPDGRLRDWTPDDPNTVVSMINILGDSKAPEPVKDLFEL